MVKQESLQDVFLNKLRKARIPVSIYLINGKKLRGKVRSFDRYALLLSGETFQMLYKHAISSIIPLQRLDESDDDYNADDVDTNEEDSPVDDDQSEE